MRDSEIEQWILHEIKRTTGSRFKELCVFSANGVVSVKGTVQSRGDKLAVQAAAERTSGVVAVINELSMRRRTPARRRASLKSQVASATGTFHLPIHQPAGTSHAAS